MASLISDYAAAARPGIDLALKTYGKRQGSIYPKCFDKITTTLEYFRSVEEQDMGYLDQVNENAPHPEASYTLQNSKDHYWNRFKKKMVISRDKIKSDQTGVFSEANVGRKLVDSGMKTIEAIHAGRLTDGFGTGYLLGDGKPLFDAPTLGQGGHPLDSGIQHNRGYYNGSTYAEVSFSETGVENAIKNMMQMKSHKGLPSPYSGPFDIIVSPGNMFAARKLIATLKNLGTNYNDANVVKDLIGNVIENPFLIGTSWFLHDTSVENPLKTLMFEDFDKYAKANYDEQNVEIGISVKFAAIAAGWRGWWGTYGA